MTTPRASAGLGDVPATIRAPLMTVVIVALIAGLYGRFKGIGTWPLGVDEFYISRSIDNVLRRGLPRFSCGGYYTRSLLYQYLVAGIRLFGLPPELAGRLVAGASSLAVLPAAYLLGKRVHGPLAGWLTVIILCVSIWEIEMARFARMYAPFQAVFTWYLVFYLRYSLDRNPAALGWMIGLSVLGVLTWEGGALLGIANILAVLMVHEQGRLRAVDWRRLAGLLVLLALLILGTHDIRGFAQAPPEDGGDASGLTNQMQFAAAWLAPLREHPRWAGGWLLASVLACASVRWIWSFRGRWLAAAGLCAALVVAAVHLFTAAAAIMVLMLLMGLLDRREFLSRPARYFILALLSYFMFWLAFDHWLVGADTAVRSVAGAAAPPVIQHLFGFPDVYDTVVRPWGRTLPMLTVGLLVALGFLCGQVIAARTGTSDPIAALLSLILVMVIIVGTIPTDRIETRYTFFLYPPLIVLAVTALLMLLRHRVLRRAPLLASAALPLLCFSATEDFQPKHLIAVDTANTNFRVGMSAARAAHYYPRNDMRAVGQWLLTHVRPGDVVITGIPNLDQYYDGFDYFFLDKEDARYEAYVCRDGRTERWTNHPVLYTQNELNPIVASGRRVFVSVYSDTEARLQAIAQSHGWSVTRVMTMYGNSNVLLIVAKSGAARGD